MLGIEGKAGMPRLAGDAASAVASFASRLLLVCSGLCTAAVQTELQEVPLQLLLSDTAGTAVAAVAALLLPANCMAFLLQPESLTLCRKQGNNYWAAGMAAS